jgi:predicted nucleic acid-binding protein
VNYLDTSVVLAHLLGEDRQPPRSFWSQAAMSSRLLEYEVIVRLHARKVSSKNLSIARALLDDIELVPLDGPALELALQPLPVPLRTLDAMHLATLVFLRGRGIKLQLATYDKHLGRAAEALGFKLAKV